VLISAHTNITPSFTTRDSGKAALSMTTQPHRLPLSVSLSTTKHCSKEPGSFAVTSCLVCVSAEPRLARSWLAKPSLPLHALAPVQASLGSNQEFHPQTSSPACVTPLRPHTKIPARPTAGVEPERVMRFPRIQFTGCRGSCHHSMESVPLHRRRTAHREVGLHQLLGSTDVEP
jgi:hypothetical protein